jgi:hypothetical protein
LKSQNLLSLAAGLCLLLASCQVPPQVTTTSQGEAALAVFTAAASTAEARMTESARITPTTPPTPTITPSPTPMTTITTTLTLSPTLTLTPAAQAGADRLEFVADISVPDGTVFDPGETFDKTWRLLNTGTSTWTTAYNLVFFSGEMMGGPASLPLPLEVAPGKQIDLSVSLTAPEEAGDYTGYWMLQNAQGQNFGIGPEAKTPFYVQIVVE